VPAGTAELKDTDTSFDQAGATAQASSTERPGGLEMSSPDEWSKGVVMEEVKLAENVRQNDMRAWEADSPREALAWLRVYVEFPGTQIQITEKDGQPSLGLPARPFYFYCLFTI